MTSTRELLPQPAAPGCAVCAATGFVDPTGEQVAAYGLLPGTRLRCGACDGTGAVVAPEVCPAA